MKYLIFSDLHINKENLKECQDILMEIYDYYNDLNPDKLVILGDTFHYINPTPLELDLFANFVIKIKKPIILIVAKSHESYNVNNHILNHFSILKNNVIIYYDNFEDIENNILFGHFMVKESLCGFKEIRSIKDFVNKYKWIFLGHQHVFQQISKNAYHIGSVRYVRFDEDESIKKCIIYLDTSKSNIKLIYLKSTIPIKNIQYSSEDDVKNINNNTKVRLIIKQSQINNWLKVSEKYQNKFMDLKIKIEPDYQIKLPELSNINIKLNFKNNFKDYLNSTNISNNIINYIFSIIDAK